MTLNDYKLAASMTFEMDPGSHRFIVKRVCDPDPIRIAKPQYYIIRRSAINTRVFTDLESAIQAAAYQERHQTRQVALAVIELHTTVKKARTVKPKRRKRT